MTDRGHVYQPGENPLTPWPMTQRQLNALVTRARSGRDASRRKAAVARRAPANRKLSDAAVVAIRRARDAGEGIVPLAHRYGVSNSTVSRIVRGQTRKGAAGPVQQAGIYVRRTPAGRP